MDKNKLDFYDSKKPHKSKITKLTVIKLEIVIFKILFINSYLPYKSPSQGRRAVVCLA